jgi:pimeloyl-ACP methyl ester carboxylesterase
LHYQEKGSGKYTFVLIHNAGGDSSFFTKQIDVLTSFGKVVLIDLPGHGRSKSHAAPTVSYFSDQVVQLCKELKWEYIIGVGLNYGANILLEINASNPGMLCASVMIDPPVFINTEVKALIENNIHELESGSSSHHAHELVKVSFIKTDDATRQIAIQAFTKIDTHYLAQLYRNLIDWDRTSQEKVKQVNHRSLLITTDAALCSIEDMQRVNPGIISAKVVGSMYWATLEVPQQVNSMIDRFMQTFGNGSDN